MRVLEQQGYRELVSAHLFAAGLPLAPTIDDKHMLAEHARDGLRRFFADERRLVGRRVVAPLGRRRPHLDRHAARIGLLAAHTADVGLAFEFVEPAPDADGHDARILGVIAIPCAAQPRPKRVKSEE